MQTGRSQSQHSLGGMNVDRGRGTLLMSCEDSPVPVLKTLLVTDAVAVRVAVSVFVEAGIVVETTDHNQ